MVLKLKFLVLFLTASFLLLNETACSQEQNKSKEGKATLAPEKIKALVATYESVTAPAKGKAVDFTFMLNGKKATFKEYTKGKVVFLNFWGTWCPPCRKEIPDIVKISNELKGKDFVVIGIPQERNLKAAVENVTDFAENNGIKYLNVIDGKYEIGKAYGGINAVPTTYIIDKSGNISETIVGMQTYEAFMKSINRVLK